MACAERGQYTVWVRKAIEDGLQSGMPESYANKYLRPVLPVLEEGQTLPPDIVMVRTTKLDGGVNLVPRGFASWERG